MGLPIVLMTVPLVLLLAVRARARSAVARRVVTAGIAAIWLYAVYETVALGAFALFSPAGIGAGNWPELGVALVITIGLPAWALVAASPAG